MKKILLIILLISIISGLFTGCGMDKSNSVSTGNKKDLVSEKKEKARLKLLFYYEGQERFSLINSLCNGFNNEQGEIEVVPEFVPFENLKKRIMTGFAEGTPPDLVIFDKPDQAYLADKGILADLTERINQWTDKSQYFESSMKSCTYNGRLYGLPFGENCLGMFYNKRMFDREKVKPPETWEELRLTAKKLSKDNVKGIGICAQDSEQGMFQFLPWFFSANASLDKLDSPQAVKAFSFLADLVKDGSMSGEVINWSQADVMKQFADEKIAMMLNGPWQFSELKLKAPNLEYGVARIPMDKRSVTILGGENIGITEGQNKDAAIKFLMYVCRPEKVSYFTKAMGYFPSRKDVAVDETLGNSENAKVFAEGMQYAIPRGPDPKWPEISKVVTKELHEVLAQIKPPEVAARNAQEAMDKILKR